MVYRRIFLMTTFLGKPVTLLGKELETGEVFPDFTAVDANLADVKPMEEKGPKIILAVPSLDTPVCSLETHKFLEAVKGQDTVKLVVVSEDLPFAQARWAKENDADDHILIVSDYKDDNFAKKTGTRMKENGLLARSVFVTDPEGKIIYEEYVDEVSHEPDYKAALSAAGIE